MAWFSYRRRGCWQIDCGWSISVPWTLRGPPEAPRVQPAWESSAASRGAQNGHGILRSGVLTAGPDGALGATIQHILEPHRETSGQREASTATFGEIYVFLKLAPSLEPSARLPGPTAKDIWRTCLTVLSAMVAPVCPKMAANIKRAI